ncbi:MAG: thioredoxin domain-containing protein, partial [Chitinophagia bacterium]|nr:thioredoxin domain-containing protein [Chitinophagia bacterium]
YVWSKEEFEAVVGEHSKTLCDYFNIKEDGNWEHVNILFTSQSIIEWANEQGISEAKAIEILSGVKKKLLNARESRIRPGLDDKIILGWNALLSNALFQTALVFNESSWMEVAEKNTQFLSKEFFDEINHQWKHTYKNKVVKFPAFLDDLAYFIQLLLTAHQATAALSYLHQAKEIAEYVIEHFSDDENTYFYFSPDFHHDIMVRKIDLYDGATPSGNSIMAYNLMSLGIMFDQKAWKERAHKMLEGLEATLLRYPTSFGKWGNLFIELNKGIGELAILGRDALVASKGIYADFLPNKVVVISDKSNDSIPLLIGRSAEENTKFFVCRDFACLAPVGEAQEAIRLLLTISGQD